MGKRHTLKYYIFIFFIVLSYNALGQNTEYVQIKVYKEKMLPFGNLTILLNNEIEVKVPHTGVVYHEFNTSNLPFFSIKISKKPDIEVESWHFTKGVLEIIFRSKKHKIISGKVLNEQNMPIDSSFIAFQDFPQLNSIIQNEGEFSINVPIELPVNKKTKFSVSGFRVKRQTLRQNLFNIVVAERVDSLSYFNAKFNQYIKQQELLNKLKQEKEILKIEKALKEEKERELKALSNTQVNDSLNPLNQLKNTILEHDQFPDSFLKKNQKTNNQVLVEEFNIIMKENRDANTTHLKIQEDINNKMRAINKKLLKGGGVNLSKTDRENILKNIENLEKLLNENKIKFDSVQEDYYLSLITLKNNIENIGILEKQLSETEMKSNQKLEEQFKLFLILLLIFIPLLFIAIRANILAKRYKSRGIKLAKANEEINDINANLELRVEERTEELKATNLELDTFFYRASHDLKRPITSIIGLADIANLILEKEGKELFEKAKETAVDMGKMLEKLIMISNFNVTHEIDEIQLDQIVEKILSKQQPLIEKFNIKTNIQLEQNTLTTNVLLIENLLFCIIENAIYFLSIKEGNKQNNITILSNLFDDNTAITIEDNGVGIEKKHIDKINNMFYVGHENSKGNGLGLYVANKIVKRLNGEITITSEESVKTKIDILIPLSNQV